MTLRPGPFPSAIPIYEPIQEDLSWVGIAQNPLGPRTAEQALAWRNPWIDTDGFTILDQRGFPTLLPLNVKRRNSMAIGQPRPQLPGRCYDFDGIGDTISAPLDPDGLSAYSVSFWVNPIDGGGTIWLAQYLGSGPGGFSLRPGGAGATSMIAACNSTGSGLVTISLPRSPGWGHYVVVFDGAELKFYIDGTLGDSAVCTGTINSASNIDIGSLNGTINHAEFSGFDFRAYDKALDQDEIDWLYSYGDNGVEPPINNCQAFYKCDDTDSVIAYDSSGLSNDGTKSVSLPAFHKIDGTVPYSFQNEYGYSDILIPRNESDHEFDVLGNPLEYQDQAPRIGLLRQSNGLQFDGTGYLLAPHLTGTETVVSSFGTATPTISAGKIDFTAGTCAGLVISDGTYYPMAEGLSDYLFDVSGSQNNATMGPVGITTWVLQDEFHWNILMGFTDSGGVKIPALEDKSADAEGDEIGNPALTGHNGAETEIDFTADTADVPWMNGKNLETNYKFANPRTSPNSKTTVSAIHEWRYLTTD